MLNITQMTLPDLITSISIPTIAIALIYIGRKLQVLDTLEITVSTLGGKFEDVRERFLKVEGQVSTLLKDEVAPASSPRKLNESGQRILNESGIKGIVESKKQKLLEVIKAQNITNAYDAEQATLAVVADLPKHCPDVVPQLKEGAFKVGQSTDTVLLVGGFYLRDLIFPELGFSLTDLDTPKS